MLNEWEKGRIRVLIFIIIVIFFGLILISKVDFPAPNKKIEKIIPNENFKTIK